MMSTTRFSERSNATFSSLEQAVSSIRLVADFIGILRDIELNKELVNAIAQTKVDADVYIANIQKQADERHAQAVAQEQVILDSANARAAKVISDATAEAGNIVNKITLEQNQLREAARLEANKQFEEAARIRSEAEQFMQTAVAQKNQAQKELEDCQKECALKRAEANDLLARVKQFHADMGS